MNMRISPRRLTVMISLATSLLLGVGCGGGAPTQEQTAVPEPVPVPEPAPQLPEGCYTVVGGLEGSRVVCPETAPEPEPEAPPSNPDPIGPPRENQPPPAPPPPPPECASESLAPERAPAPNLMLLVDHSGSMKAAPGDGSVASKWSQLVDALNVVVPAADDEVRWGLTVFPQGTSQCGPGLISVGVDAGSGGRVLSGLEAEGPPGNGGTPIAPTLNALVANPALRDRTRPSFVLLATDGRPTCRDGDPDDITGADDDATRAAVQALREAGIRTFVVGFGTTVNTTNKPLLNDLATLGGTGRASGDAYYSADSLGELERALDEIGAFARCSYSLQNVPASGDELQVSFDGQPVEPDPANGWTFDAAANSVSFTGEACDAIALGQVGQISIGNICE